MNDDEGVLSPEEQEEHDRTIRANETDMLEVLLGAAEDREKATEVVPIVRKGKPLFGIRVRGLTEQEDRECRQKATERKKQRSVGGLLLPDVDLPRYRSATVLKATVAFAEVVDWRSDGGELDIDFKDVKSKWDDGELRKALDVRDKRDIVDKVLSPGEKTKVVEAIERLSGYSEGADTGEGESTDDAIEDAAKNS